MPVSMVDPLAMPTHVDADELGAVLAHRSIEATQGSGQDNCAAAAGESAPVRAYSPCRRAKFHRTMNARRDQTAGSRPRMAWNTASNISTVSTPVFVL